MRLIDADALIDDLKHDVAADQDSLDYEELTDSNREIIQFDKDCKQNAIDLLQNAPTIETQQTCEYWDSESKFCALCRPSAQPQRKTGKWIVSHVPDSMLWECNQCGFDCGAHSFNFCPNCGADMRGNSE